MKRLKLKLDYLYSAFFSFIYITFSLFSLLPCFFFLCSGGPFHESFSQFRGNHIRARCTGSWGGFNVAVNLTSRLVSIDTCSQVIIADLFHHWCVGELPGYFFSTVTGVSGYASDLSLNTFIKFLLVRFHFFFPLEDNWFQTVFYSTSFFSLTLTWQFLEWELLIFVFKQ